MDYIDKLKIDDETYEIRDSSAVLRDDLLDLIYPEGSIYITLNPTHPSLLLGGDWERIQGKFLLAADTTNYPPGATGGSEDAVVPTHTHTVNGTTETNGAHTHTANSAGSHSHGSPEGGGLYSILHGTQSNEDVGDISGAKWVMSQVTKGGWWSAQGATAAAGAHTHGTTSNGNHNHVINMASQATGVDGSGKNMPPYLAVYVWKRVASQA